MMPKNLCCDFFSLQGRTQKKTELIELSKWAVLSEKQMRNYLGIQIMIRMRVHSANMISIVVAGCFMQQELDFHKIIPQNRF